MKGLLKMILMRTQKEKRRAVGKLSLFREYINNHKQNVGRNMYGKDHAGEVWK